MRQFRRQVGKTMRKIRSASMLLDRCREDQGAAFPRSNAPFWKQVIQQNFQRLVELGFSEQAATRLVQFAAASAISV